MDLLPLMQWLELAGAAAVAGAAALELLSRTGNRPVTAAVSRVGAVLIIVTAAVQAAQATAGSQTWIAAVVIACAVIVLAASILRQSPAYFWVRQAAVVVLVITIGQSFHTIFTLPWVGLLTLLAFTGLLSDPLLPWFRQALARFFDVSLVAAVMLVGSGLAAASQRLNRLSDITETPYGQWFGLKAWLVVALLVFMAVHRVLVRPVLQPPQPGASGLIRFGLAGEAAVTITVLALSTVVAGTTPPAALERHEIIMTEYSFTPGRLELNVGEPVRFVIANRGAVIHDLVVPGLPFAGGEVYPGPLGFYDPTLEELCTVEADTLHAKLFPEDRFFMEFVPLRAGNYQIVCTVARHKERGMTGELLVKP